MGVVFFNFAVLRHLHNRGQISAQEKLFEFSESVLCETSKKGQKVKGEQRCQTRKMYQKNWPMRSARYCLVGMR